MSQITVIKTANHYSTGIRIRFLFTIDSSWYLNEFVKISSENSYNLSYYPTRKAFVYNGTFTKTPIISGVLEELKELQEGKLYNKLDPMEWYLLQCIKTLEVN